MRIDLWIFKYFSIKYLKYQNKSCIKKLLNIEMKNYDNNFTTNFFG